MNGDDFEDEDEEVNQSPILNVIPNQLGIEHLPLIFNVLAVDPNSEHRQAGRFVSNRCALLHEERPQVRGDEHAATWIDVEGSSMDAVGDGVLDRCGRAGRHIDGVHPDVVFALREHTLALDVDGRVGAIRHVHESAVWMHVNRTGELAGGRGRSPPRTGAWSRAAPRSRPGRWSRS